MNNGTIVFYIGIAIMVLGIILLIVSIATLRAQKRRKAENARVKATAVGGGYAAAAPYSGGAFSNENTPRNSGYSDETLKL